ncbi:hypothetical protein ACFFX0_20550 [Citricoccus parietis]|uniref:Uncharacterized protein n=1 Tax=Citricoccus parietis TaxID=592307 RepID=A0ABV5G3D8_9MICC
MVEPFGSVKAQVPRMPRRITMTGSREHLRHFPSTTLDEQICRT